MAIVKASFTRDTGRAKASVRYIEHRRGRDGASIQRPLFQADGKVDRADVYAMIDQAIQGSYFYRLIVSPDPKYEDSGKSLGLRVLTEQAMRSLEGRFQRPIQWVAAIHADHTDHRHIHALTVVPQRLHIQDLQCLRSAATEAALQQVHDLALAREELERAQEQTVGWELSW